MDTDAYVEISRGQTTGSHVFFWPVVNSENENRYETCRNSFSAIGPCGEAGFDIDGACRMNIPRRKGNGILEKCWTRGKLQCAYSSQFCIMLMDYYENVADFWGFLTCGTVLREEKDLYHVLVQHIGNRDFGHVLYSLWL